MWNRTSSSAYPVTFCALTGWLHFRFTSKISADPGKMFLHLQFRWPRLFSFSFRKPWPNGLASQCKSKFAKAEVVYGLAMIGQTDRKFTQVSKSCKCVYTRKWLTINLYWLALGGQTVKKILRRLVYEFEQRKSSHTYVDLRRIETGRLAIGFTGELGLLHETLKVIKKTKGACEYRR